MATVQDVLDQLGTPPPEEVCLDWMYQLQSWTKPPANLTGSITGSQSKLNLSADEQSSAQLDWSCVEVDSSGLLSPLITSGSSPVPAAFNVSQLMEQLRQWSLPSQNGNRGHAHCDHQPQALSSTSTPQFADGPPFHSFEPTIPTIPGSPSVRRKPRNDRFSKFVSLRIAASLLAVCAALFTCWTLLIDRDQGTHTATNNSEDIHSTKAPGQVAVASQADVVGSPALTANDGTFNAGTDVGEGVELLFTPQPDISQEIFPPVDRFLNPGAPESFSAALAPAPPSSVKPAQNSTASTASDVSEATPIKQLNMATPTETEGVSPTETVMVDIVRELSEWKQTEEKRAAEQNVASQAETTSHALTLMTSPAFQLQSFELKSRARQPMWTLRLSASQGIAVEPSDAQTVREREWVSWTVADDQERRIPDSKQPVGKQTPATQVMIQTQIAQQRPAALRWRIVAGAEDFPGVTIPLDKQWLEWAHQNLNSRKQWMEREHERLTTLARTPGMPREARNNLYALRRQIEAQQELATRWTQIVADAQQLDGWLDGQLDVHAVYSDMQSAPPTRLLQFGMP